MRARVDRNDTRGEHEKEEEISLGHRHREYNKFQDEAVSDEGSKLIQARSSMQSRGGLNAILGLRVRRDETRRDETRRDETEEKMHEMDFERS